MNRQEFVEAVDWEAVAAGMRETRAELDCAIQQRIAEIRAEGRRETLGDKETLAAWQGNADLLDAFLTALTDA
jgi:hypothetical protein